jgi:hypothetical protein
MSRIGLVRALQKADDARASEEPNRAPLAGTRPEPHHDDLGRLRGIILGSLQNDQDQALASLENRIASQSAKIRGELDAIVRRLENRIEELDTRSSKDQDDLREKLLSQSKLLNDAIEERSAQVTAIVKKGLTDLGNTKLDRQRFSAFVTNLREHLGKEELAQEATSASEAATSEAESERTPIARKPPWHPVDPPDSPGGAKRGG